MIKPETIVEEDEEEVEAAEAASTEPSAASPSGSLQPTEAVIDEEVAAWVKVVLEKKRNGTLGKAAQKPALHAAPLDTISSPPLNGDNQLHSPPPATMA
jgi:mitogen-activated protein kinase kinase